MQEEIKSPSNIEYMISASKSLCESSWPPLNPIAKSKYNDINLLDDLGISKSLFTMAAIIPNKKNKSVGFVKFETII